MYDSQMHLTASFYAKEETELLVLIDRVRDALREEVLSSRDRENSVDSLVRVGESSKAALCIEFYDDGERE